MKDESCVGFSFIHKEIYTHKYFLKFYKTEIEFQIQTN